MRPFSCHRYAAPSAVRVAVEGELDILTVPHLDRALRRAEGDAEAVILDLRELEFVDSSGAHLLLAASRRIREAGGQMTIVRSAYGADRFFTLIGLDRELDLVERLPPVRFSPARPAA